MSLTVPGYIIWQEGREKMSPAEHILVKTCPGGKRNHRSWLISNSVLFKASGRGGSGREGRKLNTFVFDFQNVPFERAYLAWIDNKWHIWVHLKCYLIPITVPFFPSQSHPWSNKSTETLALWNRRERLWLPGIPLINQYVSFSWRHFAFFSFLNICI